MRDRREERGVEWLAVMRPGDVVVRWIGLLSATCEVGGRDEREERKKDG